ncbi:hypothetical protein HDZ31DRAFT_44166 [Schizophyllum fasciatum]
MAALKHWAALSAFLFVAYVYLSSGDKLTQYYALHLALLIWMDALLIPAFDLILFHVYPALGRRPPHKDTPAYRRILAGVYKRALFLYVVGFGLYYLYETMTQRTIYEDLGVSPSAPLDEIRKAFKGYARQHHPDKAGHDSHATFMSIRNTYEAISQPQMRFVYDRFGSFMTHCDHCTTVMDYINELTLLTSGPLYIITFVALAVMSLVGFSPRFLFLQWFLFFGTIAVECALLLLTPAPAAISNTYAESEIPPALPLLAGLRRLFPNILIFQYVRLLHDLFVVTFGAVVVAGRAWHIMLPDRESFLEEFKRLTLENNLLADDLLRAKLRPLRPLHPDACALLERGGTLGELADDTRVEFCDHILDIITEANMSEDDRRTMKRVLLGGKADRALGLAFSIANGSPSTRMPGTLDDEEEVQIHEEEESAHNDAQPQPPRYPNGGPARKQQDRRSSFPVALNNTPACSERLARTVHMPKAEAEEFARHSARLGPTPLQRTTSHSEHWARRRCRSTEPDLIRWA